MKEKIIVVTGSSRGIGRAVALAAARTGANIVLTYNHNRNNADIAVSEVYKWGGKALCLQLDVSSRMSIKIMIKQVIENFGRLDVLVNNAGILQQKPFLEITDEDWGRVMDVNLKGAFMCSQEVFPLMQRQGYGSIINIASSGGQLGGTLSVHYSASKAGVICLTKSLAQIGAPYGIRVNCVSPGLIETEMTKDEISSTAGKVKIKQIPMGRPGNAEEIASAVLFLASDEASYITGQTINVNGGFYLG